MSTRDISKYESSISIFEHFMTKFHELLNEKQTGFRKHYRTSDHILILKSIIEKAFNKSYIYICFVNLRKAFDIVWREALF